MKKNGHFEVYCDPVTVRGHLDVRHLRVELDPLFEANMASMVRSTTNYMIEESRFRFFFCLLYDGTLYLIVVGLSLTFRTVHTFVSYLMDMPSCC